MKRAFVTLAKVCFSFLLGLTSLMVFFVTESALAVPGRNPVLGIVGACLVGAPYLAFCQFWLAPRGAHGFRPRWPALAAMTLPLFGVLALVEREAILPQAVPMLLSGGLGIFAGAVIAGRVPSGQDLGPMLAEASGRLMNCRRLLQIGAVILVVAAVMIPVGVIPPLMAELEYATGFKARQVAAILGSAAGLNLVAAAMLLFVSMHPEVRQNYSSGYLVIPAVLVLLLAFLYAFASGIRSQNPALVSASVVLTICAVSDLATTALITAASVVAERVGLGSCPGLPLQSGPVGPAADPR
ncbi:MAG: hypothetical protein WAK51_05410 [Opitutaceae bacterium]